MDKICGIYCIENSVNGKKYIGQSIDVYKRWRIHKNELNQHKHINDHLQYAWDKYGEDKFAFYIIEVCEASQLDKLEVDYISKFDTTNQNNGYNLNSGGGCGNKEPNEYVRQKLRDNHADVSGENNPNYGKVHSAEIRKKMSENHADVSGKHNPNYGKHMSEETKRKIIANRNTPKGENHVNYGKTFSEEIKAKMRANHADFSGSNHPQCRPVYCPELDREFWGAKEVELELGIRAADITSCLRGRQKSAGKHPTTGEKLHWFDVNERTLVS